MADDSTTATFNKRKRSCETENLFDDKFITPLQKLPRIRPDFAVVKTNRPQGITKEQQPRHSRSLPVLRDIQPQDEALFPRGNAQQNTRYRVHDVCLSVHLNSRKRHWEEQLTATEPPQKRVQLYPGQTVEPETASKIGGSHSSCVEHWVTEKTWPKEFFESGFSQPDNKLLARAKSGFARKRSESSIGSVTTSDQRPRETKAATYRHREYPSWLKAKGVYMKASDLGITDDSKRLCRSLLETKCNTPTDCLFRDDIFDEAIAELQDKNEFRIIQDVARLLVPSASTLAKLSEKHLSVLVESVNDGWNSCIPMTDPRPQPDYAVGFGRDALSAARLKKLEPLVGDSFHFQSPLMATFFMFFPVLTSEIKMDLDLADRQNAHSMGIAVRAIVHIFQLAKRESEIHRELLTFSVSHDHERVQIHGWYPVFKGSEYTIHRHLIHAFYLAAADGRDKWTTFRFSVGVYERAVGLLEKINTIIDELPPDLNLGDFEVIGSQPSKPSKPSGLSQQMKEPWFTEETVDLQPITPDTSTPETRASRKKNKQG